MIDMGSLYYVAQGKGLLPSLCHPAIFSPEAMPSFGYIDDSTSAEVWDNYNNLIGFSHFRVFLEKSTFASINGHPKQYILVDTIFNYRFHFGLPGKCLYLSPQNTPFGRRRSRRQKGVFSGLV